MRIQLVTPAPRGSRVGNRVTALRWAAHLRALGHAPRVRTALDDAPCDLLVAMHALRSADAVEASKVAAPDRPVVVVLTGTDVYGPALHEPRTQRCLALADRIVVLQAGARAELGPQLAAKVALVPQSARARPRGAPDPDAFEVLVVAHLRPVKDPLLAARAARRLPADSRVRVVLAGAALDEASAREARAEEAANPRFTWLGPLRFGATQARMAAARVLAMTSRAEGGPAVVSEAIAAGLPVLATRIPGARSLLGDDYPGLFEVGDEAALAALLARCEREPEFLAALRAAVERRAEEVSPAHERACIAALLADLARA